MTETDWMPKLADKYPKAHVLVDWIPWLKLPSPLYERLIVRNIASTLGTFEV